MLHKEIEFKCQITEEIYLKLINIFDIEPLQIINYYFDTDTFSFYNDKIVIRIRQILNENFCELTMKTLQKTNVNLENNINIDFQVAETLIERGFELNTYFPSYFSNVHLINKLEDYRIEVKYDGGLLVIDKSVYNNITDYEIEYETKSLKSGKIKFDNFLKENDIKFVESKHKITRVFETTK